MSCVFGALGAASAEVCQSCLPGHYCAEVGLSSPSGPCNPGFYCTEGSRTATPWGNTTGDSLTLLALQIMLRRGQQQAHWFVLEMVFVT